MNKRGKEALTSGDTRRSLEYICDKIDFIYLAKLMLKQIKASAAIELSVKVDFKHLKKAQKRITELTHQIYGTSYYRVHENTILQYQNELSELPTEAAALSAYEWLLNDINNHELSEHEKKLSVILNTTIIHHFINKSK